ncbi:MAG: hypothetical protein IPM37_03430 [Hahellaceae bacterium]|nr:hypothetical protein [Hahellaceae bacterium]
MINGFLVFILSIAYMGILLRQHTGDPKATRCSLSRKASLGHLQPNACCILHHGLSMVPSAQLRALD